MTDSIAFRGLRQRRVRGSLRNILPRQELYRQDSAPGRFPTVARVGDPDRNGTNNVWFDDTRSVVFFTTGTKISFPSGLPSASNLLASDFRSDLTASEGRVSFTAADWFMTAATHQTESLTPFVEHKQFSQDLSGSFVSGSNVNDVGLGFSSNIRDKTIIRLALPIATSKRLVASGGYYYNFTTKQFDGLNEEQMFGALGATTTWQRIFNQKLLFNAFGNQMSRDHARLLQLQMSQLTKENVGRAWDFLSTFSLLQSSSYEATGAISFSSFIPKNKQFVVEKAVLELPFAATTGWLQDSTKFGYIDDTFQNHSFFKVGGPAVSVALMNQISPQLRDVIATASFVPHSDTIPWYNFLSLRAESDVVRTTNGFTLYSTPAAIVSGSSPFTGSVRIDMTAAVSNGVTVFGTSSNATGIQSVNPFGRAMMGNTGRSVFGRDSVVPQSLSQDLSLNSLQQAVPVSSTAADYDLFAVPLEGSAISPYLLSDLDKLVIYVSTPIDVLTGTWDGNAGDETNQAIPSASYDVSIPSGMMYLTLFGSQVSSGKEFHDTCNQRLDSNAIHEAIGFDPIIDQFDVSYGPEFSGSYVDDILLRKAVQYLNYDGSALTGSGVPGDSLLKVFSNFSSENDGEKWNTQFRWTKYKHIFEIKQAFRNVQHRSSTELFWDCRIPSLWDVALVCNPSFTPRQNFANDFSYTISDGDYSRRYQTVNTSIYDWNMTYPFEPRYKDCTTTFGDNTPQKFVACKTSAGANTVRFLRLGNFVYEQGSPSGSIDGQRTVAMEVLDATGADLGVGTSEMIKYFYGIGDGVSPHGNQWVMPRTSSYSGGPGGHFIGYAADIRGWKHGLFSGFPMKSSAVFRRDHYGHPRDMLEQRLDSKFFDSSEVAQTATTIPSPVTIRFLDSDGNATLPEYTFSSNLSNEATSSRPYTDGIVRNREEPILFARLNQTTVVI